MTAINYADMIDTFNFSDKHVVQIYSYQKWSKSLKEGQSLKELDEIYDASRLIMCGASNVKHEGFLYPILKDTSVEKVIVGEGRNSIITIFLNGDEDILRTSITDAAIERKRYVNDHNYERYTNQLKADFIF